MAIPIIGQSTTASSPLPDIPDADAPPPGTLPENTPCLAEDLVRFCLSHPEPLVRSFGVDQAQAVLGDDALPLIAPLVADDHGLVASVAMDVLARGGHEAAIPALKKRFLGNRDATGRAAAEALGKLAPDTLLGALQEAGRLDDRTYAQAISSLSLNPSDETEAFFAKALDRSGAMSPERRSALFGAVLLSGRPALCRRVIARAIEESEKKEEKAGTAYPARMALAAGVVLDVVLARHEHGPGLFDELRPLLSAAVLPILGAPEQKALDEALRKHAAGPILAALAPVLDLPPAAADDLDRDLKTGERRRGLLSALLEVAPQMDRLPADAQGIFAAAAGRAAAVVASYTEAAATASDVETVAKALELPTETLRGASDEQLCELFRAPDDRNFRRVAVAITRAELSDRDLKRFTAAIAAAGRAGDLFGAVAESDSPGVIQVVVDALGQHPAAMEPVLVQALENREEDDRSVALALEALDSVRTQRVAAALARNFARLRPIHGPAMPQAMMRLGSAWFLPLLKSRAFADEPEERAWAVLSLAHQDDSDPALREEAIARVHRPLSSASESLTLGCANCQEVLHYEVERVYFDPSDETIFSEMLFVGAPACKACGDEGLRPTERTAQALAQDLTRFAMAARTQGVAEEPFVWPAQVPVHGKTMGYKAALKGLSEDIDATPDAIRPRLMRARINLRLKRDAARADIDHILSVETDAPEALLLSAAEHLAHERLTEAAEDAARAHQRLSADEAPRLYEEADAASLQPVLEDLLLAIRERGTAVPDGIDLSGAESRAREAAVEQSIARERFQAAERGEGPAHAPEVSRNAPCPCGSGKRYKACHGKKK